MAEARTTQGVSLVLARVAPTVRATQSVTLILDEFNPRDRPFVTQSLGLAVVRMGTTPQVIAPTITQAVGLALVRIVVPPEADTAVVTQSLGLALIRLETVPAFVAAVVTQALGLAVVRTEPVPPYVAAVVTQSVLLALIGGDTCTEALNGSLALSWRELRRRTFHMLGEDSASPVYWTHAEIGRYVNDAYMQICRETKVLEFIESTATVSGTSEYQLSQAVMQVKRVWLNDWKIPNITKWERDREYGNWEGQSNKIKGYMTSQQDNRKIMFDQEPTAVQDVDVWYVGIPTAMDGVCEVPETPIWTHLAIAYKAASRALRKYGETRNLALADAYEAIANDSIALIKAFVAHRIGER